MMRSWLKDKRLFYLIFLVVLIFHVSFFKIHIINKKLSDFNEALVVRIENTPKKILRQIVESNDSEVKESKDAEFLSNKNRHFDRQTKARKVAPFQNSAESSSVKKNLRDLSLSDLAPMEGKEHPLKHAAKKISDAKKGSDNGKGENQVSSTSDYIEEIPLGDTTYLNTAEYKFYGFYHRVRQKLEQFWNRSIHEKAEFLTKSGRAVAMSDDYITSLRVTLDAKGRITEIKVVDASGVKELDDAAVESFNKAGPFPNPPKGLLSNGKVILEWGFVVKT